MKKLVFSISFFFLISFFSTAQTPIEGTSLIKTSDILFGGKASFALTNVAGDGLISSGPFPGFQIGAVAEIPIQGEFYFAPEVLFSLQGTRGVDENIKLGYLNVPLMAKYHITDAIAVELGPQVGVLLTDNLEDFLFEGNNFDIGLGLGGGYRLNDNFYFQLRLNAGFLNVIENVEAKNVALQVGAIYYFL